MSFEQPDDLLDLPLIDEETSRHPKRRPYKGPRLDDLEEEFYECIRTDDLRRMLRVLRAEGYSAEQIAAFAGKWREQRGGGSRPSR